MNVRPDPSKVLRDHLAKLVGQRCWTVIGGRGNGSRVTIDFGQMISKPPRYEREFLIFILGCSWRFEHSDKTVCTWRDSEKKIALRMRDCEGLRILKINITGPSNDLRVEFDKGYSLFLFCDQSEDADPMENYSIRFHQEWFTVGPGKTIERETQRPRN